MSCSSKNYLIACNLAPEHQCGAKLPSSLRRTTLECYLTRSFSPHWCCALPGRSHHLLSHFNDLHDSRLPQADTRATKQASQHWFCAGTNISASLPPSILWPPRQIRRGEVGSFAQFTEPWQNFSRYTRSGIPTRPSRPGFPGGGASSHRCRRPNVTGRYIHIVLADSALIGR